MLAFTLTDTALHEYLLAKPEARLDYPFGPEVAVYKVRDKLFALATAYGQGQEQGQARLNLKCDPLEAQQLRMVFRDTVIPGYHMNKKHWNSVILNGSLPRTELLRMVDNSYALVVKSLGKTIATRLLGL